MVVAACAFRGIAENTAQVSRKALVTTLTWF
jgi:hypothetical protein